MDKHTINNKKEEVLKMYSLGGINESGRNMVAFEINSEIVICDIGLQLSNLVLHNNQMESMSYNDMIKKNILPNPELILDKKEKVKAIVISHAHLDHVGGVQYLAHLFPNAVIYGSQYTIEVLKILMRSSRNPRYTLRNKFIALSENGSFNLESGIKIELVHVTHSTPQSSMIAIHSPKGILLYGNDFKFDNRPLLGKISNYERLKELQKIGIKLMVVDSVRSNVKKKNLSEVVVKEMLRDIFLEDKFTQTQGVIITTFASHITRLKAIFDLAKEFDRKLVFLGRSMKKYCLAAKHAKIIDFEKYGVTFGETRAQIDILLRKVQNNKSEYLVVCTGHQGEEGAVMSRIAEEKTPFILNGSDKVIFSSEVIPTQINIEQSQILHSKLDNFSPKVYTNIHVSGHATRGDHIDLLNLVRPEFIIPAHGNERLKEGMNEVACEFGYVEGKNLLMLKDQRVVNF